MSRIDDTVFMPPTNMGACSDVPPGLKGSFAPVQIAAATQEALLPPVETSEDWALERERTSKLDNVATSGGLLSAAH